MGIREDYAPFMDSQGYISDYEGPTLYSSGNLLRYTSEYYIALKQNGVLTDEDRAKFRELIAACWCGEPGILKRYPINKDQEGPDDYFLVATAAKVIGTPEIAQAIYDYGNKHWWNYNNYPDQVPTWKNTSAWFWRMPWLIAHFAFCADKSPGCFRNLAWSTDVRHVSGSNTDAWALSYSMVLAAPDTDGYKAIKTEWLGNLHKTFPGGIPEVMSKSFIKGPHPSRLWYGLETRSA